MQAASLLLRPRDTINLNIQQLEIAPCHDGADASQPDMEIGQSLTFKREPEELVC